MFEFGVFVAAIVGLNQLFKTAFEIPKRYLPLLSLLLGLLAGIVYFQGDMKERVFMGVVMGLSASGLFDQSKIITKRDEE